MRQAMEEIPNAGYDHPVFWAPFVLIGDIDQGENRLVVISGNFFPSCVSRSS